MIEKVEDHTDETVSQNHDKKVGYILTNVYEFFKPYIFVSYVTSLEGKTVTATLYLKEKVTERKFVVGSGSASVFFEENFVLASGEHWAYFDAVKDAESKLREFAAFNIFLNNSNVNDSFFQEEKMNITLARFYKNEKVATDV